MPRKHHPYCRKINGEWMCELKHRNGNVLAVGYGETRKDSIDDALEEWREDQERSDYEKAGDWAAEHPIKAGVIVGLGFLAVRAFNNWLYGLGES